MTTPEGKVKSKVRNLLDRYNGVFTYWPVPMGFGRTTVDVLGCYRGRFFAVETKADGKKPTLNQSQEMQRVERAMGKCFVIIGEQSPVFEELRQWLDHLTETVRDDPHISPDPVDRRPI